MKAYQVLYTCRTEYEARQCYQGWAMQEGFIGGRYYPCTTRDGDTEWVFQGFFPCPDSVPFGPTECDGMSVVVLLDGMLKTIQAFAGHLVVCHTSVTLDTEGAQEFLSDVAQVEGFIGAVYVASEGGGVRVKSYYQGPGHEVRPGFEAAELPNTYLRWHKETVKRPGGMSWPQYAQTIKDSAKRAAIMDYLATWDYIVPDEIRISYLG